MAHGLSDLIPGLREAEDRYRRENAEAFAGVEPKICGMVEILPLTPKMFIDLEGAENALLATNGKPILVGDVATFLWRCSPYYRFGDDEAVQLRQLFNASLYVLPAQRAVDEIFEYVRRSWAGMPQWKTGKGDPDRGVAQWPSRLVHMFAKEYGWKEEYILNLPFRRLWQYANRVLEANDPDYKEICATAMKLRGDYLLRLQTELDAAKGGRN